MISNTLYEKIEQVQKKNTTVMLAILIGIVSFILYFSYMENGYQNWMIGLLLFGAIFAFLATRSSKALFILKNNSDQISKIVLDQDNSLLEIEVHLTNKNYSYSISPPFDEGLEIAQELMRELPNIDFYDDYNNKIENIHQAKFRP
jgi:hypothetical protein